MAESVSEEITLPFSIVKVKSPDFYFGIWNPVVKNKADQKTFYEFQEELNDYYCTIGYSSAGFSHPRIGQLVVVRHPKERRWHRATADHVLEDSSGYRVVAFLVDKAEMVSVSMDGVRKIADAFTQFPFQGCLLELPGLYPRSIMCDPETVTMHYSRASKWDTAAIRYIDGLIKAHRKAEIRLIGHKDGCGVVGDLYLHNENGEVTCVRSSLVSLGYAVGSATKYLDDISACATMEDVTPCHSKPHKPPIDMDLDECAKLQSELDEKFRNFEVGDTLVDDMPSLSLLSPERNSQFSVSRFSNNFCNDELYRNPIAHPLVDSSNEFSKHSKSVSSAASSCKISLSSSSSSCYSTRSGCHSVAGDERVQSTTFGRGRALFQKSNSSPRNDSSPPIKSTSPRDAGELMPVARLAGLGRSILKSVASEPKNGMQFRKPRPDKSERDFLPEVDYSLSQICSPATSHVFSTTRNGGEDSSSSSASDVANARDCLLLESTSKDSARKSEEESSALKTVRPLKMGRGQSILFRLRKPDVEETTKKNNIYKVNGEDVEVVLSRYQYVKPPTLPYFSTCMDKPLDIVVKSKFRKVLVCGPMQPDPLTELKDTKFDDLTYKKLSEMKIDNPKTIQAFVWPALTRGRNVVVISPPGSGKSITYLAYLLSRIKEKALYADLPKNNQPVAVILCSTWEKAKSVYDAACFISNGSRDARVFLIYGGGYDESQMEYLVSGCDLLVATPCSLLRLMKRDGYKPTGFTRLCYFVLDDADILTDKYREQIKELLNLYKEHYNQRPNKAATLAQIMTFGTQWTDILKGFIRSSMFSPLMISSSYCENAVYAGVKTFAHLYKIEDRFQRFFDDIILPYHKVNNQKTLICTSHKLEALDLYRVLLRICPFALLAHHGMGIVNLQGVSRKWREGEHRPGEMPILIATDSCLESLNIEDVECLIHYDVPNLTKSQFGRRFSSMMKYMRRSEVVSPKDEEGKLSNMAGCVNRLLITETSYVPAHSLIYFLRRLNCVVPRHLLALAEGYYHFKEEQKSPIPLCYFVKAFGKCPDIYKCIDRHILSKVVDAPSEHLVRGVEVVLHVTCVRNASQLYGRVVKHKQKDGTWKMQNASFLSLSMGMAMYFSSPANRIPCETAKLGDILAVCVDSVYYRVRITYKYHVDEKNGREVQAFFVDDGRLDYIAVSRLLCLPDEFSSVPPQTFEIFLSSVRPIDYDVSWTDRSVRAVQKMAARKEMSGKISFSLGNTLWLSSLTKQTRIIKTEVDVENFDVCKELLTLRYAMENPDHLRNLEIFASKVFVLHPPIVYDTIPEVNQIVPIPERTFSCSFLPLGEFVDVFISCVGDPRRVYLQKAQFNGSLDELMDDIDKHTKSGKAKRLKDLSKGALCLAPLPTDNNSYYRARIITINHKGDRVSPDDQVFTFYVDYGDTSHVRAGDLFQLDDTFLWKLPFQAIECGLANICPPDGAREWTEEISDSLYHMSLDPNGSPQIMSVKALKKSKSLKTLGNFYDIVLYDTSDCGFNDIVDSLKCTKLVEDVPTSDAATEVATRPRNEVETEENASRTDEETLTNGVNGQNTNKNNEADFTVVPYVQWAQQSENIRLTVRIANVKEENQFLDIDGSKLSFNATANKVKYQLNLELFDAVKLDQFRIMETYVRIVLTKTHRKKWPRLTANKEKLFFLSVDFDYCLDSSDEEEECWPQTTTLPSKCIDVADGLPPDPKLDFSDDNDSASDSDDDSSTCLDLTRGGHNGYEDFL